MPYAQAIVKVYLNLPDTQHKTFEIITFVVGDIDRMVRPGAEHVKHLDIAPAVRGRGENNLPEQRYINCV